MPEIIVFGDVEDALRLYVEDALLDLGETVAVSVTVPTPRQDEFIIVPRLGGPRRDLVTDGAVIGVECWAGLASRALEIAQLVRGIFHALPGQIISGLPVYRVEEQGGPALLPPADGSEQSRYVLTEVVHVRYERVERI